MPSQTRGQFTIEEAAAQIAASGGSVEVLALTTDESLLDTLREAIGTQQRIWHAPTADQAIEQIMAGNVGVIVIDTLTTGQDSAAFCENLRAQFPDVVLIVAGDVDDQTHLVKQITAGDIYRFLHKPVSTARVRQFIETAVRRHLEGRTFTPVEVAPTRAGAGSRRWLIAGGSAVAVAAVAIVSFVVLRSGTEPEPDTATYRPAASDLPAEPVAAAPAEATDAPPPAVASDPESGAVPAAPSPSDNGVTALLARAQEAFARGEFVAPSPASALDLYREVLARDAGNAAAQAGLDQIADQLLTQAENALLEERIDDAARDIDAARSVRPNNMRLAFISAQLIKERERSFIAMARDAAAKGNHERARVLIERAGQGQAAPSPVLVEARKELEQLRRGASVGNLLRLANERLKDNRLVEPANDNARSYIEAALAADPGNAAALQARRALADQLLARGRQAIAARDPVTASSWLSQAESLNAERATLRAAQRDLQTLRQTTARGDQLARLTTLLNERIAQDRIQEPASDSATYYFQELRALDSANAALGPALQGIGQRLVQRTRQATLDGRFDDAQRALDEARRLGVVAADLASAELALGAARERSAFLANVVAANSLPRTRQVAPRYPPAAERRRIEGWVEVDFTIGIDGKVKDLVVRGAEPAGVFEEAATDAISRWEYNPVMRNGRAVEQRARLRLRFDVPD